MDDAGFEQTVDRLLNQDLSSGTEEFRDNLLQRCLDVLGCDESEAFLDDADLDLIAAAGDPFRNYSEGKSGDDGGESLLS